ncbi:MAG: hypothetical protein N3F05_00165 [Candidatus Diapherotrites archaeon]|nr:hypothetical protein [Candidatus Diapherotrites archaeon]
MALKASDFIKSACKGEDAIAFIPKKKHSLNLKKIRKALEEKNASIIAETPFLLMFRFEKASISLFKSGKILIKGLTRVDAERIFCGLVSIIN